MARSNTPMSTTVPAVLKETMESSGMTQCSAQARSAEKITSYWLQARYAQVCELVNWGCVRP